MIVDVSTADSAAGVSRRLPARVWAWLFLLRVKGGATALGDDVLITYW